MLKKIFGTPNSLRRIYGFSLFSTIVSLIGVLVGLGPLPMLTVLILCALEITFSFDNAVVNAKILNRMNVFWREMFMTVGIIIAVFGMRLLLPVVLVAVTAGLGLGEVGHLALTNPTEYAAHLHHAHPIIASFGGMFLLMIFLEFMLDASRDVHWIQIIERPLVKIGQLSQLPVIIALVLLVVAAQTLGTGQQTEVLLAGLLGIITHLIIHALASLFEHKHQGQLKSSTVQSAFRAGLFNFLYLEILDASFSFDGVIGAFAITKMIALIAIGLGIGAIWVRSMTVHMVRRHTLSKYRYLDHGAHYAIGALAIMLLVGIAHEIPEAITGLTGIIIIGCALFSSWRYNQRQLNPEQVD